MKGDSRCSENKGKDRPTRTAHVAFVDASHYRPQIIFCSHKHAFKGFSLFERDDRRFCCQEETSLNLV